MTFFQRDFQLLKESENAQFEKVLDVKRGVVVSVEQSIEGDGSRVWVRPLEDNAPPLLVYNPGTVTNLQAGMIVFYRREPREPARWQITGFDKSLYADNFGDYATLPGSNVEPHAQQHEYFPGRVGADPLNVHSRAIVDFAVRPTDPPSMRVRVHPGWYPGLDYYERFKGPRNTKDFTSDVPAGQGMARIVAICIDKDGQIAYVNGGTFANETPPNTSDRPQVPADKLVISAVRLVNGMTAITEEHFDHEMRPVFAPGGLARATDAARVSKLVSPDGALDVVEADNDGNVAVIGNVDGVDISAHAANPDAHHNRIHAMTDTSDHYSITNWSLFHSNEDAAIVELPLGADGTFLRSNGATTAPAFDALPVAGVISHFLALPGLRGLWPMSIVDASGNTRDLSGNGLTLVPNGNPVYDSDGLAPYIDLDGTGDFLSRSDTALLDILGTESYMANPGLTLGGWFWFNNAPGGSIEDMIGKDNGSADRAYRVLRIPSTGILRFSVSNTGADTFFVDGAAMTAAAWWFVVARFTPSTELAAFLNGGKTTNTTSIPASISNSSNQFNIGAVATGALLMTGRASLCFVCAAALSDDIIDNLYQSSRSLFGV